MAVVGVSITLAIIFSVRYGLPSDNSSDKEYAPNETRIIAYSPIFCDHISISTSTDTLPPDTRIVFSVLSEKPQLIDHDSFQFLESPLFNFMQHDYQYWSYHLYQGSSFGFSACKKDSSGYFMYYVIKGTRNFNSWVNNPRSSKAIDSNSIPNFCSTSSKTNYTHNVATEDDYYMVFFLEHGSTSGALNIQFDVYRTKYVPMPESDLGNCTLNDYNSQLCTVEIPLRNSYGLLSLSADSNVDWSESSNIDIGCGARVWVYVAISLLSVSFFVLIMVCIMACCCYFVRRQRKKYTPLSTSQATPIIPEAPSPTTAAYVTGKEAPPPYNPMYGGAAQPPKYT